MHIAEKINKIEEGKYSEEELAEIMMELSGNKIRF
jgi:hypothetical protein